MATSSVNSINGVVNTPFISTSFQVQSNSDWLKLTASFSKKGWMAIFVWDPKGQLRVQSLYINEVKEIYVSTDQRTTSFSSVAGEITQGEWTVEILCPTYKSEPTYDITYDYGLGELDIEKSNTENWATLSEGGFELTEFDDGKLLPSTKKWYKGDFHTHTTESDGKMSPSAGMQQAKDMGLDFFVATDHNIVPTKWLKDEVLVIPGVEITAGKGHFNALGLSNWIDWRPTSPDGGIQTEEGMNRVIKEVKESGAIFSVNHPMLKPWAWEFQDTKLADIDTIEIWNDPTFKDNVIATEEALKLWNVLWNDGYRIFGLGGSDSHLLPTESYEKGGQPSVIGDPATYVMAEELSAQSLLKAVRQGKTYVTRGPVLDVEIVANGKEVHLGSDVTNLSVEGNGVEINYKLSVEPFTKPVSVIWVQDGVELARDTVDAEGGTITRNVRWSEGAVAWFRFEIRDLDGVLLAFGNPIFQGEKDKTLQTWADLIEKTFG
ncbi:CehA/McbA family metallohydrolase [Bacillus sp. AK128]